MTFGEKIASLRQGRGWTVYRLSEEAGVHRQYLGQLEKGSKSPSLEITLRLARALGVSLAEFDGVEIATPAK